MLFANARFPDRQVSAGDPLAVVPLCVPQPGPCSESLRGAAVLPEEPVREVPDAVLVVNQRRAECPSTRDGNCHSVYVLAGNAYCPTVRSEIDSCCVNFRAYGSPVLDLHPDDEAAARRGQIRAKISWARLAAVPR